LPPLSVRAIGPTQCLIQRFFFPGNTELEYECDRTVIINLQYVVTEETLSAYMMVLVQYSLGKTEKKHEKIH
jgi:hypothetical protein